MKRILLTLTLLLALTTADAQQKNETPFKGYLFNDEYKVYMRLNFYEQDVIISWQELFGPLPGFLAREGNNYCWIVTDFNISDNKAELEMTNDYGSEDLTATLTQVDDSTYTLRQKSGSTLKVPAQKKGWTRLPTTLTLKKR